MLDKANKLDSYKKFKEFFKTQYVTAEKEYSKKIDDFGKYYDKIIDEILRWATIDDPAKKLAEEKIIALSLLFRALKYTAVIFDLMLQGHVEEGQIIARNVLEIKLVALDVAFNPKGFELFKECWQQKVDNTVEGLIDISGLNKTKYKLSKCIKRLKLNEKTIGYLQDKNLLKKYGLQSEYFSHENLFNIIKQVDWFTNKDGRKTVRIFLGESLDEPKIGTYISDVLLLIKEIEECAKFICDRKFN